ncbi:MAG: hypothetical protein K9J79_03370, partial [Desulfobacteraceae bacterium]|nr:hypothetical protein [Desulfobacteraceae bacterium]
DPNGCKKVFLQLKSHVEKHADINPEFVARPGLTYSFRVVRTGQTERPLFALIDVIDENPRWLSVCFYEDMITDPEEYGDLVPEGLMGEDGYCFDVDENNSIFADYICKRLNEAYESASV